MLVPGLVIAGITLLLMAFIVIYFYNRFVTLDNRVRNSFAQIDVQLKRRADLIPKLVEVVKGYMKHERTVLKEVTAARTAMLSATTPSKKVEAGNQMAAALKTIFAVAENYPKLRASENFKALQEDISSVENKIAYARQHYNDSVNTYNVTIQKFPGNVLASLFRRKAIEWLQISSADREDTKINF